VNVSHCIQRAAPSRADQGAHDHAADAEREEEEAGRDLSLGGPRHEARIIHITIHAGVSWHETRRKSIDGDFAQRSAWSARSELTGTVVRQHYA